MNVNGSRFHLLLGETDWGRCRAVDGAARCLAELWSAPPAGPEASPLVWDPRRDELRLDSKPIALKETPNEAPLSLSARRAAAADRNGNIYWIDADPTRLRVWSVGSGRESAFWPDGEARASRDPAEADFVPVSRAEPTARRFGALAVTEDHYLVAAFETAARKGLLAFDLVAGGPPVETLWPTQALFAPFAMAARRHGGVLILDRANKRLWELDRRLAAIGEGAPAPEPATDIFEPADGRKTLKPARALPASIDLSALMPGAIAPIAVAAIDNGALLLDRDAASGASRIIRLRREAGGAIEFDPPVELGFAAHDFVLAKALTRGDAPDSLQLFVTTPSGNQALAFALSARDEPFRLRRAAELFPLRRHGGRALPVVRGTASYDTGVETVRWAPIAQEPRARFEEAGELVTPVFDGAEMGCVWDRVILDACIPPGSRVEISCRAADEWHESPDASPAEFELLGPWRAQPRPNLRHDACELPWTRAAAAQRAAGSGAWELLLQDVRGRYLQLRLRLSGNGAATPRLRALRVWYPRFSYLERFLPAVYREDRASADFLDRFLANFEGVNTRIEESIAHVDALFDPRTAPPETLDWLSSWFDLALDPAWSEHRRRLFIAHAMTFFRWRGTAHGLTMALALAFDPDPDDCVFADPGAIRLRPQSIRIVETYLTRPRRPRANPQALWSPAEGNAGLVERFAAFLGCAPGPSERMTPFPLTPPADAREAERWRLFTLRHLGFEPRAGGEERARWRGFLRRRPPSADRPAFFDTPDAVETPADWPADIELAQAWRAYCASRDAGRTRALWRAFLENRYRRVERLDAAYGANWPSFDVVPIPDRLPPAAAAQTDWLQFEGQLLVMDRAAHRFSVLLPVTRVTEDPQEMERKLQLARRIVDLEKPAHTVFDVRFYWALNRVGEARLGFDTLLGDGSRAPELLPDAVLGRAYLGESFVAGGRPLSDGDRRLLPC